jgi:hypothetical protein
MFSSTGQVIPQGLHVRLNLQTGEREAKLMDDADGAQFSNDSPEGIILFYMFSVELDNN